MPSRIAKILSILLVVAGIGGILLLYALYDPAHAPSAPKCPLHMLTGWECPSCGIQRALHSLLVGEWGLALRYNPFLCLSIPYLAAVMIGTWGRGSWAARCRRWAFHRYTLYAYLTLLVAWWIFRNTTLWHSMANLPQ